MDEHSGESGRQDASRVVRMAELEREVASLAARLDQMRAADPDRVERRARQVRERIRQRRAREQIFPADLFADPAWDMMLDLYAAYHEGEEVSVSSLCIASAVPATTALRWIRILTEQGWLERVRDPDDGRRVFIHLGEAARTRLDRYFDMLER